MKNIAIAFVSVLALSACGPSDSATEKTEVTVDSAQGQQDPNSQGKDTQATVESADRPDAAKPAP